MPLSNLHNWRGLFLIGVFIETTLRLSAQVPGNYTSGNLTFPRQPAPQYVVVDLGNVTIEDMNDVGQLFLIDYSGDEPVGMLWSAGTTQNVTLADEDYDYYWNVLADNGALLGYYADDDYEGFVSWTVGDGLDYVSLDSLESTYVSGNLIYQSPLPDGLFPSRTGLFWGWDFTTYTHVAYDYDGDDIGYNNDYDVMFCLNPNGTVSKIGDTVFNGGAEAPTGNIAITYNIATDGLGDNLTMKFTGTYTSQEDDSCYLSGFDLDDNPIYTNWSYTQTYLDEDSVTGNLYLNGTLAPNPEDYDGWLTVPEDADVLDPDNTFADSVELANIGGLPTMLDLYSVYEETPQTVDFLNSGNLTGASLTTDGDSPLTLDGINSLGLGWAGWDYDYGGSGGAYYEQLWLNGNILQPSDMFPEWALNDDGSLNATAVLPAVEWGDNATLYIENISGNSMVAAGVVADDSDNSRSVLLVPAALAVDNNRDGNISFDVDDQTTEENPFTFWLNNGIDGNESIGGNTVQDSLNSGNVNSSYDSINFTRNLENFARLWLNIGALQSSISSGNIYVGLKWVPFANMTFNGTNAPAIKLYTAYGSDGGAEYLTNSTIAADQITGNYNVAIEDASGVAGGANHTILEPSDNDCDFVFPQSVFANLTSANSTVHFLFEGCQAGQGELSLVLLHYNGTAYTVMGSGPSVCLNLQDVKTMYERWTVGDGPSSGELSTWLTGEGGGGVPNSTANISTLRLPEGVTGANFTDDSPDGTPYILLVHGWNMQPWLKDAWAETAFKRLYWQGYQGRFGTFQWPTTYHTSDIAAIQDYDLGEFSAWLSAKPLENLLTGILKTRYGSGNISVLGHSMGNVVAGEALRLAAADGNGTIVNAYVASQAAVPVHNYDPSQTIPGDFWGFRVVYSSINILGVNWVNIPVYASASTPNIYPNWFAPASANNTVINFYNANDFALNIAHWQTDQGMKPDGWTYPVGYGTTGTNPYGYASSNYTVVADDFYNTSGGNNSLHLAAVSGNFAVGNTTYGSNVNDQYEIMAFAAQAQCAPLGDSSVSGNVSVTNQGLGPDSSNSNNSDVWPADTFNTSGNSSLNYSEHAWHDAEFLFDASSQWGYWHAVLGPDGFNLAPP